MIQLKRQARPAQLILLIATVCSGAALYAPAARIDAKRNRARPGASPADRHATTGMSVSAKRPAWAPLPSAWLDEAGEYLPAPAGGPEPLTDPVRLALAGSPLGRDADLAGHRVRAAIARYRPRVRGALRRAGVTNLDELYLRVFKQEKVLEVWARGAMQERFVKLRELPICEVSGKPGPKRRRGDWQVPEGFYEIDGLNPDSRYDLSMHVSYPNPADRIRGRGEGNLGGSIYIHGGCASIGCVSITNPGIEELYALVLELPPRKRRSVPVAIYPVRLNDHGMRWLRASYGADLPEYSLWTNLKEGFDYFERMHRPPLVRVDAEGRYAFAERPAPLRLKVRLEATSPITSVSIRPSTAPRAAAAAGTTGSARERDAGGG